MTKQWLEYLRVDDLNHGAGFGLIVQCTTNGEAVKFNRGQSPERTVQTLRDLADRIERHACESPAAEPKLPQWDIGSIERIARQQGVFGGREGTTVTITGPCRITGPELNRD